MCGRYTLSISVDEVWEEFELEGDPAELEPRYNIAPTQDVPIVAGRAPTKLRMFRWGFVPFWADDPKIGSKMINARAESVADKPAFRNAFEKRRCVVIADGFYEWKRDGDHKTPYHVRLTSGKPFGFAGLWESWRPREESGEVLRSCTIITCPSAGRMSGVHHRMPVILDRKARELWLDEDSGRDDLLGLLQPLDDQALEIFPVSRVVNSARNDVPECIQPATA